MPHIIGNHYTNEEINLETGSAIMGGIRVAHATNSIVLIHVPGSVYNDRPDPIDPSVLLYTGQGLVGDQQLTRNNLALHNSGDRPLHLYVYDGPKQYRYEGVYQHAREMFTETQLDENGDSRTVYMFPITQAL